MTKSLTTKEQITDFLLYKTPNGNIKVEILAHNENVWLSQKRISELFGVATNTINEHLKNIYHSKELQEDSTIRDFRIVQKEGNREVERTTKFYNLDAILSVGYRVNSHQATQFRIWATNILKEYIIKGFSMDDERLKNGRYFGKDYFKELLERVRSIRASERKIYQQITDIFAECSFGYDANSKVAISFYANVQNKFHYAITGETAAEIISHRADENHQKMGLLSYKNSPDGRVLKSDVLVAKNYLSESEIKKLERTISSYFDYIENQIEQKQNFTMELFSDSVDKFLSFNDFKILTNVGKISHNQAKKSVHGIYDKFNKTQKIVSDFDKLTKKMKK
jgi:hypothetical protein